MATPTRVSGMMSGIDTESVVQAYVMNYVEKKNKLVKSQTKLEYKQDAWKNLNTKVYSLYNKVGTLRFSNSYNLKKTTISDATKATVSAGSGAVVGTQSLKINQLAKAGYLTGAQLKKGTTEETTLSDLGFTGNTEISVRAGSGDEKTISLTSDTKISDVIDALKSAGVNASYDAGNRRIFVSSKTSGVDNDFALTASSADGTKALNALGLLTVEAGDLKGYAANAAYAKATDGGFYYERDDEGNVKFDSEGKAIVRAGAEIDLVATKNYITDIMTSLAEAYQSNGTLNGEIAALNDDISTLNSQIEELSKPIEYSNAKDAVEAADDDLIEMLKAQADGKGFVGSDGEYYVTADEAPDGVTTTAIADAIRTKAEDLGLITTTPEEDTTAYDELVNLFNTYMSYGGDEATVEYINETKRAENQAEIDSLNLQISDKESAISEKQGLIADNNAIIAKNSYWDQKDYSAFNNESGYFDPSDEDFTALVNSIYDKVNFAYEVLKDDSGIKADVNAGATRVTAQDAKITLNGAEYTSSTSSFSINGLNITALAETGNTELTINTSQDNQGIYDKVKDFLSQYNELINEMNSLYNAESAKGYEPLTDDQKEEMSDKEIEKWEDKIKSSILRRDSSLGTLINKMTAAMSKPIQMNGRSYSLADFGIQTLGYLNAAKNEQYAYHIYGDEDDSSTSNFEDKLMSMINSDPDTVINYMQELSSQLYDAVGSEMKSSNLRSAYTVYNDKQMKSEYNSYTKSIKTWEDKIADMEDRYYKKFSAMESALAKLQSATSSLQGLLGS